MYIHMNVRLALSKATDEQLLYYNNDLENRLKSIHIDHELITCTEINYNKHYDKMHILYSDIIESCIQSADICIPKTGHNKHNNVPLHNIPGWSETCGAFASGIVMVPSPLEGLWSTP